MSPISLQEVSQRQTARSFLSETPIQQHHILACIEHFLDRQEVQTSLGDIHLPDVMPQARDMNGFLELLRPQTRQTLLFCPIVGHHADLLFLDIERSHLPNRYKQPDDGWRYRVPQLQGTTHGSCQELACLGLHDLAIDQSLNQSTRFELLECPALLFLVERGMIPR